MFDAILIDKNDDGQTATLCQVDESSLPEGDVLVDIAWTTLNYKDALAITGTAPVVRSYPMVPGIDFSGVVVESTHRDYNKGDRVVLNGWGVGEKHWEDWPPVHVFLENGWSSFPKAFLCATA